MSDAHLLKVDEVAKSTVEAIGRLEHQIERVSTPDPMYVRTSQNLSDISSQLSRIESMIASGRSPDSQNDSESGYT